MQDVSVLHTEQKGCKLDKLEILEIARATKNSKALLNEQLKLQRFPPFESSNRLQSELIRCILNKLNYLL